MNVKREYVASALTKFTPGAPQFCKSLDTLEEAELVAIETAKKIGHEVLVYSITYKDGNPVADGYPRNHIIACPDGSTRKPVR